MLVIPRHCETSPQTGRGNPYSFWEADYHVGCHIWQPPRNDVRFRQGEKTLYNHKNYAIILFYETFLEVRHGI